MSARSISAPPARRRRSSRRPPARRSSMSATSRRRRRARRSWCPRTAAQAVADLKGKKVALNKGSNVHYLLVKALEKAGVNYADIEPVFLRAGRRPRRLRARRGRCLGDLGPVPGRRRSRDRRAHAGRRHRPRREPPVLSRLADIRRRAIRRSSMSSWPQLGEVDDWAKGDIQRGRRAARAGDRHSGAGARGRAGAAGLRHQADRRRRRRRAAEDRRHVLRARPASRSRSRSPTPCGGRGS